MMKTISNGQIMPPANLVIYTKWSEAYDKRQASLKYLNSRRAEQGTPGKPIKDEPTWSYDTDNPFSKSAYIADVLVPRGVGYYHSGIQLWMLRALEFGGLMQARQLAFERGDVHFPDDYPDTEAGCILNNDRAKLALKIWAKRPPAKRVSFDAVLSMDRPTFENCRRTWRSF